MSDLCRLIWCATVGFLRSPAALQAENLILRHQLNVWRHRSPKRVAVGNIDRLLFVGLYRFSPKVLDAPKILITSLLGNLRLSKATSFGNSSSALVPRWTIDGSSSLTDDAIKEMSQERDRAEGLDDGTIAFLTSGQLRPRNCRLPRPRPRRAIRPPKSIEWHV
jgi:hypothetical protein